MLYNYRRLSIIDNIPGVTITIAQSHPRGKMDTIIGIDGPSVTSASFMEKQNIYIAVPLDDVTINQGENEATKVDNSDEYFDGWYLLKDADIHRPITVTQDDVSGEE